MTESGGDRVMDYLKQIKEEYPDVKPYYSDDLEWQNQAYSHFKEKNFVRAEEIFKKLCLSQPGHHSGFEGLAFIYYAAGEFEKAEWFMEEALIFLHGRKALLPPTKG